MGWEGVEPTRRVSRQEILSLPRLPFRHQPAMCVNRDYMRLEQNVNAFGVNQVHITMHLSLRPQSVNQCAEIVPFKPLAHDLVHVFSVSKMTEDDKAIRRAELGSIQFTCLFNPRHAPELPSHLPPRAKIELVAVRAGRRVNPEIVPRGDDCYHNAFFQLAPLYHQTLFLHSDDLTRMAKYL